MLTKIIKNLVIALYIVLIFVEDDGGLVDARFLPTRGNSDNLDRLRDLLSDILETDVPKKSSFDSLAASESLPRRYNGNDDDFTLVIPKHILNNENPRVIFKRGIIRNSFKKN